MSDIFISYTKEDRPHAERLAHALEGEGWSVWWDVIIPAGLTFDEVIEEALDAARCVIVIWTERSVGRRWVRTEAEEAVKRNILVPVRIEEVDPPLAFRRFQARNLIGWDGRAEATEFRRLVTDVERVLGDLQEGAATAETAIQPPAYAAPAYAAGAPQEITGTLSKTPIDRLRSEPASGEDVKFTAFHPRQVGPREWHTLLVYVHVPDAEDAVAQDSERRLARERTPYGAGKGGATQTIARGTEIIIAPYLPGFRFNPQRARVRWLEDWHPVEFRMQATETAPGFRLAQTVTGRVIFYVGCVIVGEVGISAHIGDTGALSSDRLVRGAASSSPYHSVFVSYSHRDWAVVRLLEQAYNALGLRYLRDVKILRSGQRWDKALLAKIDEAQVFQLCWSRAAGRSEHVEREWRHALGKQFGGFIRPVYWRRPMPQPPSELQDLHFAYFHLPGWRGWVSRLKPA